MKRHNAKSLTTRVLCRLALRVTLALPLSLTSLSAITGEAGLKDALASYLAEQPIENLRIQPDALQDDPTEDFYFVLDVRASDEASGGLIGGALHIPYYDLIAHLDKLPAQRDEAILVYCDSGSRSTQALMALRLVGYSNVWYLNGGVNRWKAEGRPLVSE